jgi:hypothetical protein
MEERVMFATLIELEMLVLEDMSRDQLIATLLAYRDTLGLDFTREWLERQSSDGLRLFMLAAKLLHVLRDRQTRPATVGAEALHERNRWRDSS